VAIVLEVLSIIGSIIAIVLVTLGLADNITTLQVADRKSTRSAHDTITNNTLYRPSESVKA